ncbi:MAG: DsrE family protein [Thermoprotei archaeon]
MTGVLILLFTSPVQHRNAEKALSLAKAFSEAGDAVKVFLLGDGVYNGSNLFLSRFPDSAAGQLTELPSVNVAACTTCVKTRCVDLSPKVFEGGLEDLCEYVEQSEITISLTSEA